LRFTFRLQIIHFLKNLSNNCQIKPRRWHVGTCGFDNMYLFLPPEFLIFLLNSAILYSHLFRAIVTYPDNNIVDPGLGNSPLFLVVLLLSPLILSIQLMEYVILLIFIMTIQISKMITVYLIVHIPGNFISYIYPRPLCLSIPVSITQVIGYDIMSLPFFLHQYLQTHFQYFSYSFSFFDYLFDNFFIFAPV